MRKGMTRNLALSVLAMAILALVAVSQAQDEHKTYLGAIHGPMPTVTATSAPTPSPGLPPWRRPDTLYQQLTVLDVERLDVATLRVAVRNDLDITIQTMVITRVRYVDGVAQPNEVTQRYTSLRFVSGEILRPLFFASLPSDPAYRVEAFGLPVQ